MNAIRQELDMIARNVPEAHREPETSECSIYCRPVSVKSCGWWFQEGLNKEIGMSLASAERTLKAEGEVMTQDAR